MLNSPFSPWPSFSAEEAAAVSRVLLSNRVNYWTGEECKAFEAEFASWCGAANAIALSNGTAALELALSGLGIGARNGGAATDEVIVPPRSFLATASAVVAAGAVPVFADVELLSGNISADTIAPVITPATRAVIVVHLAGIPCDMDPILELAATHDLRLVEDCAQAHGARYRGRSVGALGDVGCWSFCQDKIMTTGGEGGMVTTNDTALWSRMWAFKDHGKSWDAVHRPDHPPGFRWLHDSFGTNFRMTEMQAAIGRIQLQRMPGWHAARQRNAGALAAACAPFTGPRGPLRLPTLPDGDCTDACYKFYAFLNPANLRPGWTRDRVVAAITAQGVPCFQGGCCEIYLERCFDGTGWRPEARLPHAKALGETSLMFLVHPTLTADEIGKTVAVLGAVMESCSISAAVPQSGP